MAASLSTIVGDCGHFFALVSVRCFAFCWPFLRLCFVNDGEKAAVSDAIVPLGSRCDLGIVCDFVKFFNLICSKC